MKRKAYGESSFSRYTDGPVSHWIFAADDFDEHDLALLVEGARMALEHFLEDVRAAKTSASVTFRFAVTAFQEAETEDP